MDIEKLTKKEILKLIEDGYKFNENELRYLVFEEDEEDQIEGEDRRWSRTIETIINIEGRFFSILWEHGLTEMQPNEFNNQPVEVVKKEIEKVIKQTIWTSIK